MYSPTYQTSGNDPTEKLPSVRRRAAAEYRYLTRLGFLPMVGQLRVTKGTAVRPSIAPDGDERTGPFFPGPVGTCIAWALFGFRRMDLTDEGLSLYDLFGVKGTLSLPVLTGDRNWGLPDQSGTLQNNPWALISAGSSNAFTLTPTVPITSLVAGLQMLWIADRAPTGAATLDVSGLGAQPIQLGLLPVVSDQWAIGQAITTMWDGSAWQLISGGGGGGADDEFLAWNGMI